MREKFEQKELKFGCDREEKSKNLRNNFARNGEMTGDTRKNEKSPNWGSSSLP